MMMFWKTLSWKVQIGLLLCVSAVIAGFVLLASLNPLPESPATVVVVQPASVGREPIQPLTAPTNLDKRKVQLGRALFHDTRLSVNNTVSCASCHNLQTGGVDRGPVSIGIFGRRGDRNAPTVFNSGLNHRQFWDGRAATLEEQVNGPLQAHAEMGSTWQSVVAKLSQDTHYAAEFARLYPENISPKTVCDALATFERSLVTPDSRFDRYLKGETNVLTATELAGYRLFKSLGCISCHQGRNIGGGMKQPFGVLQSPVIHDEKTEPDGESQSLYKVPSLRNVARTAPYFHNGSADTLSEAVSIMSDAQLCRSLSEEEIRQIVAFLESLTGTYEGKPL
jgi:cytochrome c peroxidase